MVASSVKDELHHPFIFWDFYLLQVNSLSGDNAGYLNYCLLLDAFLSVFEISILYTILFSKVEQWSICPPFKSKVHSLE